MSQNFYSKIDDYLMGRLSIDELKEFEHEMSRDSQLRKEVELSQEIMNIILDEDSTSLREKINEARFDFIHRKQQNRFKWFAAASILLIIFSSLVFRMVHPKDPQEIFYDYYQRFEVPILSRSISKSNNDELLYSYYNARNYSEIIYDLEKRVEEEPSNSIFGLMLISVYFEMDSLKKVQDFISLKIRKNETGIFADSYNWYFCLSLLKQGYIEDAYKFCEIIEKTDNSYAQSARRLRKSLKKHYN